ncbi:MAG: Rossmann-like and DUF2520 domain-containing protein, partial [Gemmatimonadales bacterium]
MGAGRMGQGLALALGRTGAEVALLTRSSQPWGQVTRGVSLVLIATPDSAIGETAAALAAQDAIGAEQVVLHLSGLLDRNALASLAPTGAGLGSFHPLQTISDPSTAPARLLGAYAGIEGDPRAVSEAESLAASLGMRPVRLTPELKPAYHAGAVFASNYVVALAGVAERLARSAGVPEADALRLYLPLLRSAAANLDAGPVAALTGPIARGDADTVVAHLAA